MNERDAATEALIREVDEDLKRDQFDQLWKAYGKFIVAGAIALVLGVAGNEAWNHWKTSQAQAESASYLAANIRAQQSKDMSGLDDLAKSGKTVYATLAAFRKAGYLTVAQDLPKAVDAFQAAAASKEMGPLYQSAARLHALMLEIDSGDPAKLEAELAPLAAPSEPWRHSAQELQALLALRVGDNAKAQDIFSRLADDATAPQGLRARAAELRQALEAKGPRQ